ncbi:MAG: hypothetical protein PHC75_03270 [Burkholderiales bacterium]|nr:hypothetical protein [Burkholderiales bacterium]
MIKQQNLVISFLIEQYKDDELQDNLASVSNKIRNILDDFIRSYAPNLIKTHAIKGTVKKYDIIYRVKDHNSLKEKFYRSNLLTKHFPEIMINKLINDDEDYKSDPNILSEIDCIYEKMGDIIGIRVLTDLESEVKYLFQNISSQRQELATLGITFSENTILHQPEQMDNGLYIYKLDGSYKGRYSFELQIKSRMSAAWGDMEHSAFYKDHSISPVREITKNTMTSIGYLLHNIDTMIESTLSAEPNYEKNSKVYTFLNTFDTLYSTSISNILDGVTFSTQHIEKLMFNLYDFLYKDPKVELPKISTHLVDNQYTSIKYSQYCKFRDRNYNSIILEMILAGWYVDLNKLNTLEAGDYDAFLEWFLANICESIIKQYISDYNVNELDQNQCRELITLHFDNCCNFSHDMKYILEISIYKSLNDIFLKYKERQDDGDSTISQDNKFLNILSKSILNENLDSCDVADLQEFETFLTNSDITECLKNTTLCHRDLIKFIGTTIERVTNSDVSQHDDMNQENILQSATEFLAKG